MAAATAAASVPRYRWWDTAVGDGFQKHSYPWGVYINAEGKRFVDEGADFRNYTYARYGAEILRQPGAIAAQLFDAQTAPLLRPLEYEMPVASAQTRLARTNKASAASSTGLRPSRSETGP